MSELRRIFPRSHCLAFSRYWFGAWLLFFMAGSAAAQSQWHSVSRDQFSDGRGPSEMSLVYDKARACTVLQEQNSGLTWEWRGARWRKRGQLEGVRKLVFSDAAGRCLAMDSQSLHAWDGEAWAQRGPSLGSPWIYNGPGLAHDEHRNLLVVVSAHRWRSATFEFDGTSWQEIPLVVQPPFSFFRAMAFDRLRGRTVLFTEGQTWEWDGVSWTHRQPANSPVGPAHLGMVFDSRRGVVVLVTPGEIWEWDGIDWASVPAPDGPQGFHGGLAYDEGSGELIVVEAGRELGTWSWDGRRWTLRDLRPRELPTGLAMAADPESGDVMAFGGWIGAAVPGGFHLDGTLRWDGDSWESMLASSAPSPRASAVMFYDSAARRMSLFGGEFGGSVFNDLWGWTGSAWQRILTATTPPARPATAVVFDQGRGRAVLFGGGRRGQVLGPPGVWFDDTWEWDGVDWNPLQPSNAPAARFGHAMAYDVARSRVVLFGGDVEDPGTPGASAPSAETWEWDGSDWLQMHPASHPPGGAGGTMTYHPALGRVVLQRGGIWSWDGADWTQLLPASTVSGGVSRSLAVDPATGALLVPSSMGPGFYRFHTHLVGLVTSASSVTTGPGCPGSSGVAPRLRAAQPWLGTQIDFEVVDAAPGSQAVLMFSRSSGAVSFAGCTLHLGGVDSQVTARVNGYGVGGYSVRAPNLPTLRGAEVHGQALILDTMAPRGFALSNAQRLILGDGD